MIREDVIAAIATGMTASGIGIIRISGAGAVEVGDGLFRTVSGKRALKAVESHKMHYGFAVDGEIIIDEVMAVVMKAPRSFTGEDVVEIQCHGGALVMQKILQAALHCGARLAEPGEFTKRAFLNGRIDLSRAEAVMDVIHSQNEYALSSSVSQLRGALFEEVKKLRGQVIYEIAFIESAIDDPEHMSLEGYPESLLEKVEGLCDEIGGLISTAENGRLIKDGISTVIVGKPNVGKSSLMNCLVGEDRAIVTDIAGTTRDVLQESIRLGNISLNIVDTAGIRDSEDIVEKIGVERAKKYAQNADLIVYVADVSVKLDENDREIISFIQDNMENKKVIILLNKSDLKSVVEENEIAILFREPRSDVDKSGMKKSETEKSGIEKPGIEKSSMKKSGIKSFEIEKPEKNKPVMIKVSARDKAGLEEFGKVVKEMFFKGELKENGELVITNLRHKEALQEALDSLQLVKQSIEDGMPEDFYSIDLMNCYAALGRIIGEEINDDLVEEIFSKFCMGK